MRCAVIVREISSNTEILFCPIIIGGRRENPANLLNTTDTNFITAYLPKIPLNYCVITRYTTLLLHNYQGYHFITA